MSDPAHSAASDHDWIDFEQRLAAKYLLIDRRWFWLGVAAVGGLTLICVGSALFIAWNFTRVLAAGEVVSQVEQLRDEAQAVVDGFQHAEFENVTVNGRLIVKGRYLTGQEESETREARAGTTVISGGQVLVQGNIAPASQRQGTVRLGTIDNGLAYFTVLSRSADDYDARETHVQVNGGGATLTVDGYRLPPDSAAK